MNIRLAKPEDKQNALKLIDELIKEINKNSNRPEKTHEENAVREIIYDKELKRDDIKMFVAEIDGKLVGLLEFFIVPNLRRGYYRGNIETLVVTEKMRGKKVGTMLIDHVFTFCKKNNIKIVKVTSGLPLVNAHHFYEKHGGIFSEKLFRFELS